MSTEQIANLISNDGVVITVPKSVACHSETIQKIYEELEEQDSTDIHLPVIDGLNLKRCVEYMRQMEADVEQIHKLPENIPYSGHAVDQTEWEKSYLRNGRPADQPVDKEYYTGFFPLLGAANYLACQPLIRIVATEIASSFLGKTDEEVCKLYDIKEKLTEEQKAKILEENKWHEER